MLNNYKDRNSIPEEFKWNLSDLFADDEAWQGEKIRLEKEINNIKSLAGVLAKSAKDLEMVLNTFFLVKKDLTRLAIYAYSLSDLDISQTGPLLKRQEADKLSNDFSVASSFIFPEIISLSDELMEKFLLENEGLKIYQHYLYDCKRFTKYIRNLSEEKIISQAGNISNASSEINEIFRDVNMIRPTVVFGDDPVYLSDSNFSFYRSHKNRDWRRLAFEELFKTYKQQENFFGIQFSGYLRSNLFYKEVRNYSSCLEASLYYNNVPVSVYQKLISTTNKNLDKLHRYLKLRQRILGLSELNYYDLAVPLVDDFDKEYSIAEAKVEILNSLQALGDDYTKNINLAFNNRWIDFYYTDNKRSGAYSNGSAYDVHPYILMNYMGKYRDVSTLTHELGHALHSYYSNRNQAYVNSHYPIFLAEVASTCNEYLLNDYLLKKSDNLKERLYILGSELEYYRTTLFRQTKFAEFELKVHELVESGKVLSGEDLSKIYLDLLRKYYGHDQGVMKIDDLYGVEWAYIPHFYYNFYVFQYATSLCASNMIAKKIITKEPNFKDDYINLFLSSGCSNYPIDTLKKIGVDLNSDEPYELAFSKMEEIMNEIENILNSNN